MRSPFDLIRRRTMPGAESGDSQMRDADAAIRDAHAGRITVQRMLETILKSRVFIPLSEPPLMNGRQLQTWNPATVTKPSNGARFVVAFTNQQTVTAFSKANPDYSYCWLVESRWVLDALPSDHGIAFNIGGESGFEWPAEGISEFRADQTR